MTSTCKFGVFSSKCFFIYLVATFFRKDIGIWKKSQFFSYQANNWKAKACTEIYDNKLFKENTFFFQMLTFSIDYNFFFTPHIFANLDHYFKICHGLAFSSTILKKIIVHLWIDSIWKVEKASYNFSVYRSCYVHYLRSYRQLKFGDFLRNFKCTVFFAVECIYIYIYIRTNFGCPRDVRCCNGVNK